MKYLLPAVQSLHIVTDLMPSTAYSVTGSVASGKVTVDIKPGSGFTTSKTGVLSFQTSATGAVTP